MYKVTYRVFLKGNPYSIHITVFARDYVDAKDKVLKIMEPAVPTECDVVTIEEIS